MSMTSDSLILLLEELKEQAYKGQIVGIVYCAAYANPGHVIGFEGDLSTEDLFIAAQGVDRLARSELQDEVNAILADNGAERLVRGT